MRGSVLNGECVDGDACGLHALNVFDEIGRVGGEVLGLEDAAAGYAAGLHPERSGPGGGEDFDVRINGEDLLHDGDDVGAVGLEGEFGHGGVGLALGEIVVGVDVVVHVGGSDGVADVGAADGVAFGGVELMEELGAFGGRHLHEELGAASCDGEAEAVDGLEGLFVVDGDGGAGGGGLGEGYGWGLELEEGGAVGIGEPEVGLGACGEGGEDDGEENEGGLDAGVHEDSCCGFISVLMRA